MTSPLTAALQNSPPPIPSSPPSADSPDTPPRMRNTPTPGALDLPKGRTKLPDQYARELESLTQQIHQLRPSLDQGFAPLMKLCDSLKAQEQTLKAVALEYPDAEKTQQLSHALAALLRELDQALENADAESPSCIVRLDLEQIRKLCFGIAVCIPDDGDVLIDASELDTRRAAQRITNKLLVRAGELGLHDLDKDAATVLDILNLICRGLSSGLIDTSTEVNDCLTNAIGPIVTRTDSEHSHCTLSGHNIGRCAHLLSTILRHTRICEPPSKDAKITDTTLGLRSAIKNLCYATTLERLTLPSLEIVSLQNISTLLKDALDRGHIIVDEDELRTSLQRFGELIPALDVGQLLPVRQITADTAERDCRPLVTLCNLVRELGERLSIREGQFSAPPAWLANACTTLVAAINSDVFDATKTNAVQRANLFSFVRLCDKLVARDTSKDKRKTRKKTRAGTGTGRKWLDNAIAKLTERLLKSPACSYTSPGQLIAILAGIEHFLRHAVLRRSDALDTFCSALVKQVRSIDADDWDDRSLALAPVPLNKLADLGMVGPADLKAVLATLKRHKESSDPDLIVPVQAGLPHQDDWQTAKNAVKTPVAFVEVRGEPALMIRTQPKQKQADIQNVRQQKTANTKKNSEQRRAPTDPAAITPGGPAQAIAAGDDRSLEALLREQPDVDITKILEQALAGDPSMDKRVLTAFDRFFSLAEKFQPASARGHIVAYFTQHPPQTAGLQALLQQRAYLDSPPDLRALQSFDGMLKFLRTASDDNFKRSAALPGFGRLLTVRDGSRATLLHKLVELDDIRAVDRLLSLPATKQLPLFKDKSGQLPLHAAIVRKQAQAVEHLLSHETGPEQAMSTDGHGSLPLVLAIECQVDAIVNSLLSLGNAQSQANHVDEKLLSPLHHAALHGHTFAAAKLLFVDPNPNKLLAANFSGYTPLAIAAIKGSAAMLELLLSRANASDQLGRKDREENNVLHIAISNGRMAVIEKLLHRPEADALARELNKSGLNALMLAAGMGHAKVVEQLLKLPGAAEMLRQTNAAAGGNARDIAIKQGKADIARMLEAFISTGVAKS